MRAHGRVWRTHRPQSQRIRRWIRGFYSRAARTHTGKYPKPQTPTRIISLMLLNAQPQPNSDTDSNSESILTLGLALATPNATLPLTRRIAGECAVSAAA